MARRWNDPEPTTEPTDTAPVWSARWLEAALGVVPAPTEVPLERVDWSDPLAVFWHGSPHRVPMPRTEDTGEYLRDAEPDPWKLDRAQDRYEAQFYGA